MVRLKWIAQDDLLFHLNVPCGKKHHPFKSIYTIQMGVYNNTIQILYLFVFVFWHSNSLKFFQFGLNSNLYEHYPFIYHIRVLKPAWLDFGSWSYKEFIYRGKNYFFVLNLESLKHWGFYWIKIGFPHFIPSKHETLQLINIYI